MPKIVLISPWYPCLVGWRRIEIGRHHSSSLHTGDSGWRLETTFTLLWPGSLLLRTLHRLSGKIESVPSDEHLFCVHQSRCCLSKHTSFIYFFSKISFFLSHLVLNVAIHFTFQVFIDHWFVTKSLKSYESFIDMCHWLWFVQFKVFNLIKILSFSFLVFLN